MKKKGMRRFLVSLLLCAPMLAFALSPSGVWTTIDDQTGKKRALVQLEEKEGVLSGKIIALYQQPGDTGLCHDCPIPFKDKPIIGLEFLWGLKKEAEGVWTDGHILDAKTGKIYRAKLIMKHHDKLYVRGYIGLSMLGRTQVWIKDTQVSPPLSS